MDPCSTASTSCPAIRIISSSIPPRRDLIPLQFLLEALLVRWSRELLRIVWVDGRRFFGELMNIDEETKSKMRKSMVVTNFCVHCLNESAANFRTKSTILFRGSLVTLIGILLQTAAQNIAMFVIARIILGFGSAISGVAAAVYLNETYASKHRAWGVGILNDFYYVGALIAAGVTLGTGTWESTWAWRAPSLFQGIFSGLCILILPFVPESPRWLVYQGYPEEARICIAQTNADGDLSDPVVLAVYKEIIDTLKFEKERSLTTKQIVKDPVSRKRLLVGMSAGPFSCIAGNIIASYYLGAELDTAGVTDSLDQLKANVVLNVWCLGCALLGTFFCASWGRKPTALLSYGLLVICLFIIGGLAKIYADDPDGASTSLVYGNVAVMFLFQGFYSIAWTPLLYLYPTEVMNYAIRANGTAFSSFMLNALA